MRTLSRVLGLTALLSVSGAALAADPKAADTTKSADGVKRDPKGVKGISPYQELINKGDRAYAGRELDGALVAYREAIQSEPQNPLGYYRMGAVQLAKGDQKEAEAAWVNGLRFVDKDGGLKAKLIFMLADLRERQKNTDEAIGRWKEYAKVADDYREAGVQPATAVERLARNEAWKKNQADSAAVKERIAKRLKEAEEAARKSASDPKNK